MVRKTRIYRQSKAKIKNPPYGGFFCCLVIDFLSSMKVKMRIFLAILFSVITFIPHNAGAVTCPATELGAIECNKVAGCGWDGVGCAECSPGTYSVAGGACTSCPSTHSNSQKGSTSINSCYKTCAEEEITNGKKIPKSSSAYYNNNCEFNITCNSSNDQCNGFHEDKGNCISNKQPCTKTLTFKGTHNGFKFWNDTNKNYSECYITECTGDRHMEDTHTICDLTYANDCAANRGSCQDKLGNCNGTISGSYSWVNQYKYDDCICSTKSTDAKGSYRTDCHRIDKTGDKTQWGNCTTAAETCVSGYCANDPSTCSETKKGYYHSDETNTRCEPCPMGSTTSGTRKTRKEDCHTTTSTQFCDKNGCFNLSEEFSAN